MFKWIKNIFSRSSKNSSKTGNTDEIAGISLIPSEYRCPPQNVVLKQYIEWCEARDNAVKDRIISYISDNVDSWYTQVFRESVVALSRPKSTITVDVAELFSSQYIAEITMSLGTIYCGEYEVSVADCFQTDTDYLGRLRITCMTLDDNAQKRYLKSKKSATDPVDKSPDHQEVVSVSVASEPAKDEDEDKGKKSSRRRAYDVEYYRKRKEAGTSRYHYLRKIITDPQFAATCSAYDREMAARLDARNKRKRIRSAEQLAKYNSRIRYKAAEARKILSNPEYASSIPTVEKDAIITWYNKRLSYSREYYKKLKNCADKQRENKND